jgi:hypothetical protein
MVVGVDNLLEGHADPSVAAFPKFGDKGGACIDDGTRSVPEAGYVCSCREKLR